MEGAIQESGDNPVPLWRIMVVTTLPIGLTFTNAILAMVVPYVQRLGVPHAWASFIWLCGPFTGMIVQPVVGYASDKSKCRFGKRKPYIAAGILFSAAGNLLISYALEIGVSYGDSMSERTKPRAVAVFVVGFWVVDIGKNLVVDPLRALLADLSLNDHQRIRISMSMASFAAAIGGIVGSGITAQEHIYKLMPFTHNEICDGLCANVKTCFIIETITNVILGLLVCFLVAEPDCSDSQPENQDPFFVQLKSAISNINRPMWMLYLVSCLTWIAWFPFFLYNTDWVGREIYGGDVEGTPAQQKLYEAGIHEGSLGLMMTAIILACSCLLIDPASKLLGGAKKVWGIANLILGCALFSSVYITELAEHARENLKPGEIPPESVRSAVLTMFAAMGVPEAATFAIPSALASIFASEAGGNVGNGLSLGVLNLSTVIPQLIVSLGSGQWDDMWGGGNLPSFVTGGVMAVISGLLAIFVLPSPKSNA